jgi:hypothetical protein
MRADGRCRFRKAPCAQNSRRSASNSIARQRGPVPVSHDHAKPVNLQASQPTSIPRRCIQQGVMGPMGVHPDGELVH